jgi:hypothetical protein
LQLSTHDRLSGTHKVLEPESLRAYGASFNNTMTFAEALAGQVARDVLAATGAWWVEVTFVQNSGAAGRSRRSSACPAANPCQSSPSSDARPEDPGTGRLAVSISGYWASGCAITSATTLVSSVTI